MLSGRWQTFRTTRTGSDGSWAIRYAFRRTCGLLRYRFRARLPAEAGYAFQTGTTKTRQRDGPRTPDADDVNAALGQLRYTAPASRVTCPAGARKEESACARRYVNIDLRQRDGHGWPLFVALGGSSYAALTITGADVRNGSLTKRDLKKNTLDGSRIKESRLSKVPRARNADRLNGVTAGRLLVRCPREHGPGLGRLRRDHAPWPGALRLARPLHARASTAPPHPAAACQVTTSS